MTEQNNTGESISVEWRKYDLTLINGLEIKSCQKKEEMNS